MVVLNNSNDYILLGFRKSKTKNKKYDAILINIKNYKVKYIPFGDIRYQHYKDQTNLKLYSKLDHNDKKRRNNFRKRFNKLKNNKFSSAYFAYYYLW